MPEYKRMEPRKPSEFSSMIKCEEVCFCFGPQLYFMWPWAFSTVRSHVSSFHVEISFTHYQWTRENTLYLECKGNKVETYEQNYWHHQCSGRTSGRLHLFSQSICQHSDPSVGILHLGRGSTCPGEENNEWSCSFLTSEPFCPSRYNESILTCLHLSSLLHL